jgi:hypothetical protein
MSVGRGNVSREQLARRLKDAEAAYQAGNEIAAFSALNMCGHYGLLVPAWLYSAALNLMLRGIQAAPPKGAKRGRHARVSTRLASQILDVQTAHDMIGVLDRGGTWDDFTDTQLKAYKRAVRQVRTKTGADFLRAYVSGDVLTRLALWGNK